MIDRIRSRDAFQRLRRDGLRVRGGALWCTFVLDPTLTSPHVAFAIGRPIGTAVVRNRLRRRLRAQLSSVALPGGWYLIGARPGAGERSFHQLGADVHRLQRHVTATIDR